MNRVLLIDDHPLVLWAVQREIQALYPQAHVWTFNSGAALRHYLRTAAGIPHDLVLLDLSLPDDDSFSLLNALGHPLGWPVVLALAESEGAEELLRAIDAGVMGFVPKRLTFQDLRRAVALATTGAVFIPPPVSPVVHVPSHVPDSEPLKDLGLTPRQLTVLTHLCDGRQNKDIARLLGVSVETVKEHIATILRTLGVSSRTQVVHALTHHRQRHAVPSGVGAS